MSVDEYYTQKVQYILDTVVDQLQKDVNRKFMFVEQAFFQRWWNELKPQQQAIVRRLVQETKQLDLSVNGGWCMHDEATPHFTAMVDQTRLGHAFLKQEFNVTPTIGWQIDPFVSITHDFVGRTRAGTDTYPCLGSFFDASVSFV